MSKKVIYILISILVVGGIITGGVLYFAKDKKVNVDVINKDYQEFDPFGTSSEIEDNTKNNNEDNTKQTDNFYKISNEPVAGAVFLEEKRMLNTPRIIESKDTKTGKIIKTEINYDLIPTIRFIEKEKGHLNIFDLSNKSIKKVSNTTIPGIQEAFIDKEGDTIIYRYLSSNNKIQSFLASLGKTKGEFLTEDIGYVALDRNRENFFFLINNKSGVSGYLKSFKTGLSSLVFNSSFSEWIPEIINTNTIYLTTKASSSFAGSVYSYNLKNKTMNKIFGGVKGLTTLSNNTGSKILFGESTGSNYVLNIYNIKEKSIKELSLSGLPEKCAWSKNNIDIYCAIPNSIGRDIPDYWYQGLVSFNDKFVKINGDTGLYTEIFNSSSVTSVDAINIFLNKEENQIFFTNKKDYILWTLKI